MEWQDMFKLKIEDEASASKEPGGPGVFLGKNESIPGETLEEKLEEQKQIAQENYQKFLRVYADLMNYKKRAEKEREKLLDYAKEELMQDLLPFIDNLERAIEHASSTENNHVRAFIEGLQLALKDLLTALNKHGLKPIEAAGQPFNPNIHDAVAVAQSGSHPPNTVIEEIRKGYLLKDRLLRATRVVVALTPEPQTEKESRQGMGMF